MPKSRACRIPPPRAAALFFAGPGEPTEAQSAGTRESYGALHSLACRRCPASIVNSWSWAGSRLLPSRIQSKGAQETAARHKQHPGPASEAEVPETEVLPGEHRAAVPFRCSHKAKRNRSSFRLQSRASHRER